MSLEQAIVDNTTAVRELIAALSKGVTASTTGVKDKPDAKKPAAETVASGSGATPKSEDPKGDASGTKALTYDEVKVPFLALIAAKGREAGTALLGTFKKTDGTPAGKLPDVQPTDFAEVLEAINAAMNEEALA